MKFGRKDYDERIKDTKGLIPEDEPVFFLRGHDVLAPKLLLEYATELRLRGGNPMVADSAIQHAQRMIDYQRLSGARIANAFNQPFEDERLRRITELVDYLDKLSDKESDQLKVHDKLAHGAKDKFEELLKLVPSADRNVIILTEHYLKKDSVKTKLKNLALSDFELDSDTVNRASNAKYVIYINNITNLIHFLKK